MAKGIFYLSGEDGYSPPRVEFSSGYGSKTYSFVRSAAHGGKHILDGHELSMEEFNALAVELCTAPSHHDNRVIPMILEGSTTIPAKADPVKNTVSTQDPKVTSSAEAPPDFEPPPEPEPPARPHFTSPHKRKTG